MTFFKFKRYSYTCSFCRLVSNAVDEDTKKYRSCKDKDDQA